LLGYEKYRALTLSRRSEDRVVNFAGGEEGGAQRSLIGPHQARNFEAVNVVEGSAEFAAAFTVAVDDTHFTDLGEEAHDTARSRS
jgi:hypothetical protein